jgi:hypothetical protein
MLAAVNATLIFQSTSTITYFSVCIIDLVSYYVISVAEVNVGYVTVTYRRIIWVVTSHCAMQMGISQCELHVRVLVTSSSEGHSI